MCTPGSLLPISVLRTVHKTIYRIEPILYERIEILSPSAASSLLAKIRAKNRAFFDSRARALAISSVVRLKYAKPIFAASSRGIVSFSAWGIEANPTRYLPFIRSPYIRRLALISSLAVPAAPRAIPDNAFNIPREMLTLLTHLLIVSNIPWIYWEDLKSALRALDTMANPVVATTATIFFSFAAFQNLTHFAVAKKYLFYTLDIRKVAKKLCYFAILDQSQGRRYVIQMIRLQNDRRFVVINMEDFSEWPQGDSRHTMTFWGVVEALVSTGFISDQGDKWSVGGLTISWSNGCISHFHFCKGLGMGMNVQQEW